MRTLYIDTEFKLHTSNDGTMASVDTDFFDGKCDVYVEGFRFVPYGRRWVRSDGVVFEGEMIAPWKPYNELQAAQKQYEKDLADRADLEAAFNYLKTGGIVSG